MIIDFKPIRLEDKELIMSYLVTCENKDCNLSFVNLFTWQFLTNSHFAVIDDCLVIRFVLDKENVVYTMPVGRGNVKNVIVLLKQQAQIEGLRLRVHGVFPELKMWFDREFPGCFTYQLDRDYFDYIYLREELAELKGKNFQAKRNHVNKFKRTYNYEYTPLTEELVPACLELEKKWCKEHDCDENSSLKNERNALSIALRNLKTLDILGGVLWSDGEIVGFTYGAPVNHNTFAVHIEKADSHVDGAYSVLNQGFVKCIPEQYVYLNREEDLGIPGLRKAKLSYHPVILLEKGYAELIENK